jgi:hypothetical protein
VADAVLRGLLEPTSLAIFFLPLSHGKLKRFSRRVWKVAAWKKAGHPFPTVQHRCAIRACVQKRRFGVTLCGQQLR